jgi:hypothetical protein
MFFQGGQVAAGAQGPAGVPDEDPRRSQLAARVAAREAEADPARGEAKSYLRCNQEQGCQMVYFHTKNPKLGKFWMAL